jgi:hypothetical protein
MSARSSQQKPRWSDADVDSLLYDFFRQEMPRELQKDVASETRSQEVVSSASRPAATLERPNRSAATAGLTVAACCLLLAAVVFLTPNRNPASPDNQVVAAPQPNERGARPAGTNRSEPENREAVAAVPPRRASAPVPGGVVPVELQARTFWGVTVTFEVPSDFDWEQWGNIQINELPELDDAPRGIVPPLDDDRDE